MTTNVAFVLLVTLTFGLLICAPAHRPLSRRRGALLPAPQPVIGVPVSTSVFRPLSTIIHPSPETFSAVLGEPSSLS